MNLKRGMKPMNGLMKNWKLLKHLTLKREKRLYFENRLCIPDGKIRETIMHDNHESLLGGHRGETKNLDIDTKAFLLAYNEARYKEICAIL